MSHNRWIEIRVAGHFLTQRTLERYIADFIQHLPDAKESNIDIDSEAILKAIEAQHGIFVERAKRIYSFSHLTFQEYFTARYIIDNSSKGSLKRLVENHAENEKWREVFLITTGMLEEADHFLVLLKKRLDSLNKANNFSVFLQSIQKCITEEQGIYSLLPTSGISLTYDRARIFTIGLLLAREYLLALDRIGSLPHTYPSARARASNNELNISFALAREITQTLAPDLALNLDKDLMQVRDKVIPLTKAPRGTSHYDIEFIRSLDRLRNQYPLLRSAFELALETDLSYLVHYLTINNLLVKCLQTECYISKKTRQKIIDGLLT